MTHSAVVADAPFLQLDADEEDEHRWGVGKSLLSTSFSKPPPRQMSPLKRATPLLSGG
jgi:hypothetical protein